MVRKRASRQMVRLDDRPRRRRSDDARECRGAWFFFLINAFKVPFSVGLGLIHGQTLALNAVLSPAILVGMVIGRWLTAHIPQRFFDGLLLAFAAAAALRLIGIL